MKAVCQGPLLGVRPHARTDRYWQVYFDSNRAIADNFGAAGHPIPEEAVRMRNLA